MSHTLVSFLKFHAELLRTDEAAVADVRRAGCPRCRGRLDVANFPRKVRGIDEACEKVGRYGIRLSLCCASEGCRKRATPPSVRFFGRRVYASFVVVLVSLDAVGVDEPPSVAPRSSPTWATRKRWSTWWRNDLLREPWFVALAARLATPLDVSRMPAVLVDRFEGSLVESIARTLALLSPLTTRSAAPPLTSCSVRVR